MDAYGDAKRFKINMISFFASISFLFCVIVATQLRERGFICRDSRNECDIPEYCTGDNGQCPKDTFKKNGNVCGQVTSPQGSLIGKSLA